MTVDEALAEIAAIDRRLDALPEDAVERIALEQRRTELQAALREASDRAKPVAILESELRHLERRLKELEREAISPSGPERRRRWITDPGAYARGINERIEAAGRAERDAIQVRIAEIRQVLSEEP